MRISSGADSSRKHIFPYPAFFICRICSSNSGFIYPTHCSHAAAARLSVFLFSSFDPPFHKRIHNISLKQQIQNQYGNTRDCRRCHRRSPQIRVRTDKRLQTNLHRRVFQIIDYQTLSGKSLVQKLSQSLTELGPCLADPPIHIFCHRTVLLF